VVTVLGKVRIGKVKGVSKELVNKYGKNFSTEFDDNKKLVYQYTDITSKRLNNHVAGYITRLKVNEKKRAEAEAAEEAESVAEESGTVEIPESAKAELTAAAGESSASNEVEIEEVEEVAEGEKETDEETEVEAEVSTNETNAENEDEKKP
jgi:small subunit ribosomal protein S17e